MNRLLGNKFLCFLLALPFLAGCNDDAPYYGEGLESELNGHYSNRLSKDPLAGNLELTYSGEELVGKEFYFHLMTDNTAKIIFNDLIYGEPVISFDNHAVSKTSAGGYSFKGSATTDKGISYSYEGEVYRPDKAILPVMKLEVKDVAFPANPLSRKGTFNTMDMSSTTNANGGPDYNCPLYFEWKVINENGDEVNMLNFGEYDDRTTMIYLLVPKLFYLVLPDVTFYADGNVTASYAPLAEDLDIMSLIWGNVNETMRAEISTSPKNLFTYYIDNDKLYLKPNLDQIIRTVLTNRTTRAIGDNSGLGLDLGDMDLGSILELVNTLRGLVGTVDRWLDKGICFNFLDNDPSIGEKLMDVPRANFLGDYQLYMDFDELEDIVTILPLIFELFDLDMSDIPVLGGLIDPILERSRSTTALNVGMILNENF